MNKLFLILFFFMGFCGFSQKDSIKFKNNDVLVGEIKTLLNGVLTMKTSYSDKDFKIEFKEVSEIYLNQTFLGFCGFSQKDSIKFKNNDVLVGEIKTLFNSGFGWELK